MRREPVIWIYIQEQNSGYHGQKLMLKKLIYTVTWLSLSMLAPTLLLSNPAGKTPCEMAQFDAEHEILRSYDILQSVYHNDHEKIEEYVSCKSISFSITPMCG